MTSKQVIPILEDFVNDNTFFKLTPKGGLVSVQDLLTVKLGRPVEFDEAVEYLKKERFVRRMHSKIISDNLAKIT